MQIANNIIPIEVKAGASGRLKSLYVFSQEKKVPMGVQISQAPFVFENNILTVPFYLVSELPRLVTQLTQKAICCV